MKPEHDIKLSYNASINTHSLKRIVGYYYKEFVELNDKFENMSEDEYAKLMITKGENAKTEKERKKIAEEYAENMKKYYFSSNSRSILSFKDQVNKLDGYIGFKYDEIEEQLNLPLLDFISYDLNNINEYIIFFINYFDLVMDKLDKQDLDKIKLNTLYEIKFISELAKKYYDRVVNEARKIQVIFKMCIDLVYQMNNNEYTLKLTKDLTREQRFFVFNQINNKPFRDISNNFKTINSLDYNYDYVDTRVPEVVISIIKAMDPKGKKISHQYQYETNNLYTAFYITLYNIIGIKNWYVKVCGNCGRYFLTPKATISYCDRIIDGELTCKDIGSKEQQKRKMEKNPVLKKHRRIQQTKCTYAKRYPNETYYQKDYDDFNKKANEFKKNLKNGKTTLEEFDKWLDTQDKTKQD